jgi:hypothetical protein
MKTFVLEGTAVDNNAIIRMRELWESYLIDEMLQENHIPVGRSQLKHSYNGQGFEWVMTMEGISPTD